MATFEKVTRQVTAPASEFDHETIPVADRCEHAEDTGCARVRVESEPQVMHTGQIGSIVGIITVTHSRSSA